MDKITEKFQWVFKIVNLTPEKTNKFFLILIIVGLIYLNNEFWIIYTESNRNRIIELENRDNRNGITINGLRIELRDCYIEGTDKVEKVNEKYEALLIENAEANKKPIEK